MFYRRALRPLLFTQNAETAHERTLDMLAAASRLTGRVPIRSLAHPALQVKLAGLTFPNPVGLAAGCDKNGKAVCMWPRLGFGFVEVGTVTASPQAGNPRPRVFRLPEQEAVINRLGFNSEGAEAVAHRMAVLRRGRPLSFPVGINIGKTRQVTGENAILDDYRTSFRRLSRYADFVVVNVSSPNTPGLRLLQEKNRLHDLLQMLQEEAAALAKLRGESQKPIFVKVSPDMAEQDLQGVAEVSIALQMAGIIATNTTIQRDSLINNPQQEGGLSGIPLQQKALYTLRALYQVSQGRIPLIGVGGISSAEDAWNRILAGASLIQVYTGLIYKGPSLPRDINRGLLHFLQQAGLQNIQEAVGLQSR